MATQARALSDNTIMKAETRAVSTLEYGRDIRLRGSSDVLQLLDLPPEIIEGVFAQCSPATWLNLALTCKTCYQMARDSRSAILEQLQRLPIRTCEVEKNGELDPYDQEHARRNKTKTKGELLTLFRKRLLNELLGAGLSYRTTVWRLVRRYQTHMQKRVVSRSFDDYENGIVNGNIDVSASTLRKSTPNLVRTVFHRNPVSHVFYTDFGLVKKDHSAPNGKPSDGQFALYACRDDPETLQDWVRLGMMVKEEETVPPYRHPCRVEVLKVLICEPQGPRQRVSVLQKFTPDPPEAWLADTGLPDVFRAEAFHVVHYFYGEDNVGPYQVYIGVFPSRLGYYHPVSIAVQSQFRVAVQWQSLHDANERTVAIHTAAPIRFHDSAANYLCYHAFCIVDKNGVAPYSYDERRTLAAWEPITYMRFSDNGKQLLYQYRERWTYDYYQSLQYNDAEGLLSTSRVKANKSPAGIFIRPDKIRMFSFQIATPFYCKHQIDNRGRSSLCRWRYLAVGCAVDAGCDGCEEPVPCILHSEAVVPRLQCDHERQLDRGRRSNDWIIVARLGGWPQTSGKACDVVDSMRKIAYSRSSSRIAVVDDKNIIRVWKVRPRYFCSDLIYCNPRQFGYPRPMIKNGCVELEPMCLRTRGSAAGANIADLQFSHDSNDILFALTDNGFLFRWEFGPTSSAKLPRPSHQEISLRYPNPVSFEVARARLRVEVDAKDRGILPEDRGLDRSAPYKNPEDRAYPELLRSDPETWTTDVWGHAEDYVVNVQAHLP